MAHKITIEVSDEQWDSWACPGDPDAVDWFVRDVVPALTLIVQREDEFGGWPIEIDGKPLGEWQQAYLDNPPL